MERDIPPGILDVPNIIVGGETAGDPISGEGEKVSYGKRERFYHSMAWRRMRDAYIAYRKAMDGGLCEVCRDKLGDTVHHKKWLTDSNVDDPDIALSFDNFRLECRDCHAKGKRSGKTHGGAVHFRRGGEHRAALTAPIGSRKSRTRGPKGRL